MHVAEPNYKQKQQLKQTTQTKTHESMIHVNKSYEIHMKKRYEIHQWNPWNRFQPKSSASAQCPAAWSRLGGNCFGNDFHPGFI